MEFQKLSFIQKTLLKYRDKREYAAYKFLNRLSQVKTPNLEVQTQDTVHFKHSGHAGDIIYSLPSVFALAKNGTAHLHLNTGRPGLYKKKFNHPLGNVLLNEKMVEMLKPLLLHQPKISACDIYTNQPLQYDLDIYRDYPFGIGGHIARWYFLIFAVYADLAQPWLIAPHDNRFNDKIVIGRTFRYRSPGIDYSFLKKYPNKIFVGIPGEYEDMKRILPDLEYQPVNDFLELATIINSCKLFIGNQSLAFSIAEGLKSNRLLEVCYYAANVIVEGKNGFDFCYQPQFEKVFNDLYEKKIKLIIHP